LLLGADHRHRHDRGPGLEGEAHEAEAEVLELVALGERLADAAGALGEDQDRFLGLEQAPAVLRRAGDLAPSTEQVRGERHRRDEALDHGADRPRRLGGEEHRRADDHGVEGELPRVVGHHQHPAGGGDVLDALNLGAEVVAVEPPRQEEGVLDVLAREAERVEAVLVLPDRQGLAAGRVLVSETPIDIARRLLLQPLPRAHRGQRYGSAAAVSNLQRRWNAE
jgi:hypothetical protein